MEGSCVVILGAGATANLAWLRRSTHHKSLLGKMGLRRAATHLAQARYKSGNCRAGDVSFAAKIPMGTAGATGNYAAIVLGVDIPASLLGGAAESLGGQPDLSRDSPSSRFRGAEVHFERRGAPHYERRRF